MRAAIVSFLLVVLTNVIAPPAVAQGTRGHQLWVDKRIALFEVTDGTLLDGVAALSQTKIGHFGIEKVLREHLSGPSVADIRFSAKLENVSVRQIIDALCRYDARYTWSMDGDSVNIYPSAAVDDDSYLLNRRLDRLMLKDVPDPFQALTPLSRQLPKESLGYAQVGGGDLAYAKPWTTSFENITVRQFINRIAEHVGTHSTWTLQGSKDEKMFAFFTAGFHAPNPDAAHVRQ